MGNRRRFSGTRKGPSLKRFRGNINNLRVPGGSRTDYLQDDTEIDPRQSELIVFLGVLMAMFGFIGLFLEKKLSRYH